MEGKVWHPIDGVVSMSAFMQREQLPYYALGSAHFADRLYGPGLIALLRDAGDTIFLLSDRRSLNAALARRPAMPPRRAANALTMRPLAGGCRRDGASYGCSWSDQSTSYLVQRRTIAATGGLVGLFRTRGLARNREALRVVGAPGRCRTAADLAGAQSGGNANMR